MAKTKAQLDRDIAEALRSPPKGTTFGSQWPKDRRYMLVNADTDKIMRPALDFEVDQIHASRHGIVALTLRGGTYRVKLRDPDEKFAVMNRDLKIIGESSTVKGAMEKAPKGESYALVRGEYTSDGRYWGLGQGRQMAVREFHPSGGFRWYVG